MGGSGHLQAGTEGPGEAGIRPGFNPIFVTAGCMPEWSLLFPHPQSHFPLPGLFHIWTLCFTLNKSSWNVFITEFQLT